MISDRIKRMVFIDDDAINNFIMQTRLEASGYSGEAIFFDNAQRALDYLGEIGKSEYSEQPDVIFLDIKMPGMDGFEFLEAFKKIELDHLIASKIVIVSSSTNTKDRQRSEESGLVVDFVEKPLSIDRIDQIAMNHLT